MRASSPASLARTRPPSILAAGPAARLRLLIPRAQPTTTTTTAQLDAAARELLALRASASDPSDPANAAVAAAAEALEAQAKTAIATLDRSHVDGVFQGHTLTGRNVKATSGEMPLGALAFNAYASRPGTLVRIVGGGDSPSRILRGGERFGVGPEAYVLSTAFDVVALPSGDSQSSPAPPPPRPIRGISNAVARGSWSEDTPERMDLQFAAMVLEPAEGTDLGDWLAAFGPPLNASMDPATGRVVAPLDASKGPKGWIDHLMTTPTHTLIRGNFGSVSLLVRAEE
jgi:hypothetical protein